MAYKLSIVLITLSLFGCVTTKNLDYPKESNLYIRNSFTVPFDSTQKDEGYYIDGKTGQKIYDLDRSNPIDSFGHKIDYSRSY